MGVSILFGLLKHNERLQRVENTSKGKIKQVFSKRVFQKCFNELTKSLGFQIKAYQQEKRR